MAKTINGSTSSQYWTYKLVVTETATDSVDRTATIKVEHFLGRTKNGIATYFAGDFTFKTVVNGETKSTSKYMNSGTINPGGWKSIGSHTFTVPNTGTPTTISIKGTQSTSDFSPSSSSAEGTMDLTILHIVPVINAATITETNSALTAISVPNNTIVNLLSIKSILVDYTLDDATLDTINVYDANGIQVGTSHTATVSCDFRNSPITSGNIRIEVIDSVGGIGNYTASCALIPYQTPSLTDTSSTIQRISDSQRGITDGFAELNIVGNYYNGNDVVGSHTSITLVEYKIWQNGTTEPNYTNITSQTSRTGGNISLSGYELSGINFQYVYNYKIKIADNFGNTYEKTTGTVPTGRAIWTEFDDFVDFYDITKQGVDILAPHVLYDGDTTTSFALSDSAANYSYITIFYRVYVSSSGLGGNCSISIPNPNGKKFEMEGDYDNGTYLYMCNASYTINDTNVTKDVELRWRLSTSGATRTVTTTSDSNIYIEKVVGYK